ncbi:MAG: DeoR/GlpR transcriptional regulator, partial [Vallitaleaceae bacterium]|nr:DeoR/GlpR transcriptional regulator [Vallitaleaceae bacterium]
MIPEERRNQILGMLYKNKSVTVKMLCDELQASEATIRRDLAILDE